MKLKFYLFSMLALPLAQSAKAQTADYAMQLEALVQTAPAKVTLSWRKIPGATQYNLQRKTKAALVWTTLATCTDTFYSDPTVVSDSAFEYKVFSTGGTTAATGYLYAGINAPAIHNRGTMVLLVDTLFRDSCAVDIQKLMQDLSGDGWAIVRHNVNRTTPDSTVKKMIVADYGKIKDLKSLLIVGHIAVPYSGELAPDGHTPDHLGAWPADVYYGDMDGSWTDVSINNSGASRAQTKNIPGDGKWDQTLMASEAELQVSRIDFSNMLLFGKTEVALMKSYLAKAHQYKMDSLSIRKKALIDDNFGTGTGEPFAANGYRNFPQLLGRNNITTTDFITTLNDSAYQWAYGCGGGSYTSSGGIGTTTDYTTKKQRGIFTMMFGSYFGDWDTQNNFLRAPMCCSEPALTACWAGRPNWFFHHMAIGEHIGYSTFITHNYNGSTYQPSGYGGRFVHVALMGDLSLRSEYIKPAGTLTITKAAKKGATLSWGASPDAAVLGYYVYRADSLYGTYTKISGLIPATTYKDTLGKNGFHYYMVRPAKLQQTTSGTYYNLGLGVTDSATVSYPDPVAITAVNTNTISMICFPNPANNILNIYGSSNDLRGQLNIVIMDVAGKIMLQKNMELVQNEFTVSEDISSFAGGTYFVQLKLNGREAGNSKIVKH